MAINQTVGNPGGKLLLLALANYADENGVCWPSQGRLSNDTEASLDTVQRQTKKLVADGLLTVERPPKRRGQWQTFVYRLNMRARPQNAAPPKTDPPPTPRPATGNPYVEENAARPSRTQPDTTPQHQAAPETKPGRIAVRPNPSIEKSIEPSGEPSQQQSRRKTSNCAAERRQAWQWEQAEEVVQDRIARRLGNRGWSILIELAAADLDRLTELEMKHQLDVETLQEAVRLHFPQLELQR